MRIRNAVLCLLVSTLWLCVPAWADSDLALVGAKIYISPDEPAIENGSILVHGGRIAVVGPSAKVKIPQGAKIIDCKGFVVTAGFWNSHVHILLPSLLQAEKLAPEQITSQLQEMLTRWGFTNVFDIASVQENTTLIRRRIEKGEAKGPRILTVGEPFWGKGGTPIYVKGFLEANQITIPEVESVAQGKERVARQIHDGADGIKIFANSVEQDSILNMPLDLAQAIVEEAHREGKPVFAHVSNDAGIEVAVKSGADILTHTTPADELWDSSIAKALAAKHVALTPTLTLWDFEATRAGNSRENIEVGMGRAAKQLGAFSQAGGQVLFGTDVGYIDVFDTSEEFAWMSRAGMSFKQILASLTTSPAQRFGYASHSGRIAGGMDADLVVLKADPEQDATALAKVQFTIRNGEIIYSRK